MAKRTERLPMSLYEAITRAETWYLRQYHAVAHGSLPQDADGQALDDEAFLCIDLVPEREAAGVRVLLDLLGGEVALLDQGVPCPHGKRSKWSGHEKEPGLKMRWGLKWGSKRRQNLA